MTTEEAKIYRRNYYLKNIDKWKKVYHPSAKARTVSVPHSYRDTGKQQVIYTKKHPDFGNKPDDYYKNKHKEWKIKNSRLDKIHNKVFRANQEYIGTLTTKIIQEVYEENIKLFGTLTCIYCMDPIEFGNDSLEHLLTASKGGTNDKENLHICCFSCNSIKGRRLYEKVPY